MWGSALGTCVLMTLMLTCVDFSELQLRHLDWWGHISYDGGIKAWAPVGVVPEPV